MVELDLGKHFLAWKQFVDKGCRDKGLAVNESLKQYAGQLNIVEKNGGHVVLDSVLFETEQDRTYWLLRWA